MDSGNSACSMQSSSGGDEEFDSYNSTTRGDHHQSSISSFFNNTPPNLGPISTPQQNPTFFDPLNNPFPQSNDLIWSQNYTNFGNLSAKPQSLANPAPPSVPLPAQSDGGRGSKPSVGPDRLAAVIKNPKKRSRASRRAPTTVLATDTANFRQMVQEFTGIPDAPFRGGGSPYSRRLDLFSAAAALRSGGGAHFNALSPFSSSPLAPAMLNSTTMVDSVVPTTTAVGGASTSNNSNNYQLASDNNLLNLQQQQRNINPLQLGGNIASMSLGNLSGFASGETVRNNDGVQENLVNFDGNNINSSDSQRIHGYNLNVSDKSVENTVSNWGR